MINFSVRLIKILTTKKFRWVKFVPVLLFAALCALFTLRGGSNRFVYLVLFICVYLLDFFIRIAYDIVIRSKDHHIANLRTTVEIENDRIKVMKDHFKTGMFFMTKEYIIQDQYTKPLEDALGETNLTGKNFTGFLGESVNAKQLETLKDYFNMVIERKFDDAMLEDINPIRKFNYIRGAVKKTLTTSFTAVDQYNGEIFILSNIEDITEAALLQEQLWEEEAKRQEQISLLFEVLQIDPMVCNDFIEDTDYEFDKINSMLKDSNISDKETFKEILTDIYQSVHAIKANAIILGLNTFSFHVHGVETKIKSLIELFDISFEDMLKLSGDIENLIKEKDNFSDAVKKIKQFGEDGEKKKNKDVLIDSLKRACRRTSEDLKKKVEFIADDIDDIIIDAMPRRIIKEVLLQLVRNSVYHGIESPGKRIELGKAETGKITLSIKRVNNNVLVRLQDDGKGLDFAKIEERCKKMHIIKKDEVIKDKNKLLQAIFVPGFSTAEKEDIHAGRGIGLNLVRDRIKEINGNIKLQTEQGKGTVFNIFVPMTKLIN
ncbi:hypothetical protein AGMMS50212_10740 [Spirochaetia bacterium]|nr:hypothetical protein AGMMS50212_10740 [Spirochaetia bacterium]